MHLEFLLMKIPVVKQGHGVVLANDGIHRSISSTDAIENLISD
jgi:hypothetical protein